MHHKFFVSTAAMITAMLLVAVGCNSGPEIGTVQGTVTVNGQPQGSLEVQFEPKDQKSATARGTTKADGTYELHYPGNKLGAPVGDYIVRIQGEEVDDPTKIVSIPAKYNTDSELTAKVEPGQNKKDFQLTVP